MQHFLLTIKTSLRNRHKFYFLLVSLFLIPTFLLADDSGSCGDGLTYTYDSGTRTLTISKTKPGTGEMGFYYQKKRPWEKYKDEIASIIINEGVTTIGVWAFHDLYSLKNVSISNTVGRIRNSSFEGCSRLNSLFIPSSVYEIDYRAFIGCNLSRIEVDKGNRIYDSRDNCNAIIGTKSNSLILGGNSTKIPDSVTSIGEYAFAGCFDLTYIFIPKSIKYISHDVFPRCKNLARIVVDKRNPKFDSRDNCNAIIESSSNRLCVGCKNTKIPNSVTSIGSYSFRECLRLTSIDIPNSVTIIENYAFYGCSKLESISIPNSVTTILDYAFGNCENLVSVDIPEGIMKLLPNVFYDCLNIRDIFLHCRIMPKFSISSYRKHLSKVITLHVPEHLLQVYKKESVWSFFKYIVPITQKEESEYLSKFNSNSDFQNNNPSVQEVAQAGNKDIIETRLPVKEPEKPQITEQKKKEKRIALVIGNADYQNIKKLNSPIKDAEDVTSKLKTLGFEEVILVRNASHQQMEKALDKFVNKAKNYDVALVYYSGHGVESKNINYLLPIEFEEREESDLKYDCLIAQRVVDKLDNTGCPMKILILDACRNPLKHKGLSDGMTTMEASVGTYIVCATSQDDKAIDGKIGENSPFTKAFLKELDKPNVKLDDVFKAVAKEVHKATGKTPWMNHKFYDDFYFSIK